MTRPSASGEERLLDPSRPLLIITPCLDGEAYALATHYLRLGGRLLCIATRPGCGLLHDYRLLGLGVSEHLSLARRERRLEYLARWLIVLGLLPLYALLLPRGVLDQVLAVIAAAWLLDTFLAVYLPSHPSLVPRRGDRVRALLYPRVVSKLATQDPRELTPTQRLAWETLCRPEAPRVQTRLRGQTRSQGGASQPT